jgi:UDP-glucose 4-epimerase
MKIVVTGGAGFVGSHTCNLLEKSNHKILAIDNLSTGKSENLKGFRGTFGLMDITDPIMLDRAFSDFQPDAVLHLAAQSAISTSWNDPQKDMIINGIGTLNLLKLANAYKVKRFVFASTSAVYREQGAKHIINEKWFTGPSTPYGISKLAAENYIRAFFPNHMILRYGNIYGPRQVSIGENQVIARALAHFVNGDNFKVTGHGRQKRDFVYVADVAYANSSALTSSTIGTFNIATGKSYSINEVLNEIENIYGVPGYGWTHTSQDDPRGSIGIDVRSIRKETGFTTQISLAEGLRRTAEWWNEK